MSGWPARISGLSALGEPSLRALDLLVRENPEARVALEVCPDEFIAALGGLLALSPPMLDSLRRHPSWIGWLRGQAGSGGADLDRKWHLWRTEESPGGQSLLDDLRSFKRREYLRIAFRDTSGAADFAETVRSISDLADWIIGRVLGACRIEPAEAAAEAPADAGIAIFALGKLGARELNYSSDVDLVFCRKSSDAATELRTLTRLGEQVIQALSQAGPDGFLYRVDMRLRPLGETGPLVPTLENLVNYYESWGETWEKQALLKLRFVAGCRELGARLTEFASAFTFARPMEEAGLEEIKRVKHRAEREYAQPGGRFHVKQGPGGIRDIEFYVQYLQLIAGSRCPAAREPATLDAIPGLAQARVLLEGEDSTLSLAYLFLRTLEHRLQLRALTPQPFLPAAEAELAELAMGLGYEGTLPAAGFGKVLAAWRERVRAILERIYLAPGQLRLGEREEEFASLLSERTPRARVRELLGPFGFADVERAWQNLRLLALGPAGRLLPPAERRAFVEFVFPLLEVLRDSLDPDLALHHLESLAAASGNRISFLRALASGRPHLSRLSNLLAHSNLCHQILVRHPEYIDGLVRGVHLLEGRGCEEMLEEIRSRLGTAPAGEAAELSLRRFRQRESVRVAYRDMAGLAGPLEISRELSRLAESCVLAATDLARPERIDWSGEESGDLTVIALGKLGSRQMHFSSDLDLMFLYHARPAGADERAALQRAQDRRVERIVEILGAVTSEGVAYEVDLRLRPEGSSGLLARSWEGFAEYEGRHMEPWERMALVRSRVLPETNQAASLWEAHRDQIVYGYAWNEDSFESLRHLKRRIEKEKSKETRVSIDFKFGPGGILDLEFLVQWLQLRHGPSHPSVRRPGTSEAIPALCEAGAFGAAEQERLSDAHRFYRAVENRYQLMEEWTLREVSRESPTLARLAGSLGFQAASPSAARRAFLDEWGDRAGFVRKIVMERVFGS